MQDKILWGAWLCKKGGIGAMAEKWGAIKRNTQGAETCTIRGEILCYIYHCNNH